MERPAPKFLGVKVKSSRVMRDGALCAPCHQTQTTDPFALLPRPQTDYLQGSFVRIQFGGFLIFYLEEGTLTKMNTVGPNFYHGDLS